MKKIFIFIFLLVFAHIFSYPVYACSFRAPYITLKCDVKDEVFDQDTTCLNNDCSVNVSKNQYGSYYVYYKNSDKNINIFSKNEIHFSFDGNKNLSDYQRILPFVGSICEENIEDIEPVFLDEIAIWMSGNRAGISLNGYLIFEPYSTEREFELIKINSDYSNCHYEEYKKIGSWLATVRRTRDYCFETGWGGGLCPTIKKSQIKYVSFLISNLNSNTLPYLYSYLFFLAITIIFLGYLIYKKEIGKLLKPNIYSVSLTVSLSILTFLISIIFPVDNLILKLIFYYLISSVVIYLYLRIRKRFSSKYKLVVKDR